MPLRAKVDPTDSILKSESKDSIKVRKRQEKEERKASGLGKKAGKKPAKLVGNPEGSLAS